MLLPDVAELVVKDGDIGATAFVGDETVFEPALVVEVVEPIGAGDAFAGGIRRGTPLGRRRARRSSRGSRAGRPHLADHHRLDRRARGIAAWTRRRHPDVTGSGRTTTVRGAGRAPRTRAMRPKP
ncbi:PfkB family carbohydrate kinase [Microbacterium sp. LWH7-1.2]|uniref:PfkB family carbohydrate kinase n=1 Tax=Microbacterium sp. LWH7-1.2 TaxID=3135257 RepID=UPI0031397C3F